MDCHCTGNKQQHLTYCVQKGQGERTKGGTRVLTSQEAGCQVLAENPSPQDGNDQQRKGVPVPNQRSANNTSSRKERLGTARDLKKTTRLHHVRA